MLYATVVSSDSEIDQIYRLNQQNLKQNLSQQEAEQEGFVTWLYSIELLKQMHQLAPSVIVKDDDKVIAYALATPKESRLFHRDLDTFLTNLEMVQYTSMPLQSYSFYLMGQICIAKEYRGKGVFAMLYHHHKEVYSNRYQMLVTEISVHNHRSQKAHEKVGFKTIHTYKDAMDSWNVVLWDWRQQ